MTRGPTFDEIFSVMAAAAVGDASARVSLPEDAPLDDVPTRFGHALNVLLDDLAAQNDRRLRLMLDSVHDYAIFMVDTEGKVSSWSSGAEMVLGWTTSEILGQTIDVFHPSVDGQNAADELVAARANGRVEKEDWRIRKDGTRFWANVVITSVKDVDGEIIGFAKVMRDLSERNRAEQAVRIANKELEAFSYSVAHDLRTPLRAINGFAQLVVEDYGEKIDDEGRRMLGSIQSNAEKMADLIDALLLLARTARSEIHRRPVDLATIAREVIAALESTDGGRKVDVVVAPTIEADVDPRLGRALLENLLGNAWKFTSKTDAPRIEVGRTEDVYFVRDNGAGFDMKFANKLFGAFQRLHGRDEFAGDGIGLATSLRIVQRHGGRIWAEGAVGKGATFSFTLPPAAKR